MAAAERDIAVVSADFGLFAFADRAPFPIHAQVHGRLAPAFADRLDLRQRVGEAEQRGAAFEQLPLEIGADAVAKNGDGQPVGDRRKLRSEERRVGKGGVSECSSRWWPCE